jgi:hypothetical protein
MGQEYNPKNIHQYKGNLFWTRDGNCYSISDEGCLMKQRSLIQDTEVILMGGLQINSYEYFIKNIREIYCCFKNEKNIEKLEKNIETIMTATCKTVEQGNRLCIAVITKEKSAKNIEIILTSPLVDINKI